MLCSTLVLVAIPSRILFHRSHFFHFHSDRGQCVYMHSANCTVERNGIPDISEITVSPLFLDTFITLSLSLSFSLQRLYYRNYSRERCNYRVLQCTEERMFWLTYTIKFSREGCVRSRQIGEEKTKQVFLVTLANRLSTNTFDIGKLLLPLPPSRSVAILFLSLSRSLPFGRSLCRFAWRARCHVVRPQEKLNRIR